MILPRRPRAAPGELLRRRLDVAAVEREVAAATSPIGAAIANKYPRFTIGLQGGTQDTLLRLLDPINSFYSIRPSMSVPQFDAGLRDAEIAQAKADARIAAEFYRSRVLNAVREVQDYVSALRWLADEAKQSAAAAEAARKALGMSSALYRDGAASYLDVVTAQDSALTKQGAAIVARARELEAYVGLLLALGGGWSAPNETKMDTVAAAVP
jgi:multidrug efflux system outer membrane protein